MAGFTNITPLYIEFGFTIYCTFVRMLCAEIVGMIVNSNQLIYSFGDSIKRMSSGVWFIIIISGRAGLCSGAPAGLEMCLGGLEMGPGGLEMVPGGPGMAAEGLGDILCLRR